jgi:hypothetical protein
MRYVGWTLGGLFLVDGLVALFGKQDFIKLLSEKMGKKLPAPVHKTLKRASSVNDTAMAGMAINNVIAGTGMVLVATLSGGRR